jgi:RNA polymerase sigma-70 factor (ECF subfamily)
LTITPSSAPVFSNPELSCNLVARDETRLEQRIRRHHERGELKEAATAAIEGFGPEILGFLVAVVRDEQLAGEVFAQFCEDLWTGLSSFQWESSFRTWGYALARNAWQRQCREPHFRKTVALSDAPDHSKREVAGRTLTLPTPKSDEKQELLRLRQSLDPEDQAVLILRIDRRMSWSEIGAVMLGLEPREEAALARKAAAVQKQFERVEADLKRLARESNLLVED